MNDTTATHPSFVGPAETHQWLVERRNEGATPADITKQLVAAGWDADTAARRALLSLRSSDTRGVLYVALCVATGVAALCAATTAHLLLDGTSDPELTAAALTVFTLCGPLAVWLGVAAHRAEAQSEFVVWSPIRKDMFALLAACTAVVGGVRALAWVYSFFAGVTGAAAPPTPTDFVHVVVSLGISVPLFMWSFAQWRRSNVLHSALSPQS